MPTLTFTYYTKSVNLHSHHLEVVSKNEDELIERKHKVPLFDIDRVIISGSPYITTPVLKRFCKLDIPVYYISSTGHWLGTLHANNGLNAQRRIEQYKLYQQHQLQTVNKWPL